MPGTWLLGQRTGSDGGEAGEIRTEPPRAVLLALRPAGPRPGTDGDDDGDPSLAELARLAETDGLAVVGELTQNRRSPDPATYLGSGKVEELARLVEQEAADLVIVDGEPTPAQVRGLEDRTGVRVADRTALILDIFAEHAHSREGKAQVELAQLAYQLPRLRGSGQGLSRVGGGRVAGGAGIGVRGPGEQRLETQRRRLRQRMSVLRDQIGRLARRRETTRARRSRNRVPSVAISGYTNAGKSSLLNRLATADALVEDALFATLDPLVRRTRLPDGTTATLIDTVGFVRHLPHQLIDAFRSTLDEIAAADLVLHVVDASAPDAIDQITTVRGVLHDIEAAHRPELLALNKIDVAEPDRVAALEHAYPGSVPVSAATGEGLDRLREEIEKRLRDLQG
ncbi:MAG: GTP-binding protein HflX [Pseudonocardia sp.]|jgi:GTP-binding protein HflX|uniref:GTPase HflX n=1 Tax=Pseudonocardia sp. TaxID=60912 RepID=UPI00260FC6F1|nr:GTPase HflX [Pseudonocardia sp.]MCU1627298.1 GTP-binding protein HflX [Pseudonocardia sp.]MDT7699943.1 GTPase [Pseudonocardiales bacterium]HEV7468571.1 GTPase HflX [Pseudonocardia sp.]